MKTLKGMMVMRESEKFIICYAQFDMGDKYKIYQKKDGHYNYLLSFPSITAAYNYYDMLFKG